MLSKQQNHHGRLAQTQNWSNLRITPGALRALVPRVSLVCYVLSCLVHYVPSCFTCLIPYVLLCLTCFTASRASYIMCCRASRVLRTLVPHVSFALPFLVLLLPRAVRFLLLFTHTPLFPGVASLTYSYASHVL